MLVLLGGTERGRVLDERDDASTAAKRGAQRVVAVEHAGAFEMFSLLAVRDTGDISKAPDRYAPAARCRSRERSSLVMTKGASRLSDHDRGAQRGARVQRPRASVGAVGSLGNTPGKPTEVGCSGHDTYSHL